MDSPQPMHSDQQKLLNRVRRIRGQIDAVEKALAAQAQYAAVLQTAAAARGAMNGLVAELIDGHLRQQVLSGRTVPTTAQAEAVEKVMDVVRSYLK